MLESKNIWTIGHSTRSAEEFLRVLNSFQIKLLADIRTFPGSRKFPHFNKEYLTQVLKEEGIKYVHMPELGGRRKPQPDSSNTAWRHPSFRGYADYMQTDAFKNAVTDLAALGLKCRVAYMCSEAMWWKCHRSLVSDYLKVKDWNVNHIMSEGKSSEHPYTSPAKPVQGNLFYN